MKAASGKYVLFLDSDDFWCATNTLSTFDNIIAQHDYDIIKSIVSHNCAADATAQFNPVECDMSVTQTNGMAHLSGNSFYYFIWTSCYRRDYLISNDIFFREGIVYEDSDWTVKAFWYAKALGLVSFPFYVHRLNPESTAMKPRIQSFFDNVTAIAAIEDFMSSVDMPKDCLRACYSRIKSSLLSYIMMSRNYPISASAEVFRSIRRSLLTDTGNYDMSLLDHVKFRLLLHTPYLTAASIKGMTLTKRLVLRLAKGLPKSAN